MKLTTMLAVAALLSTPLLIQSSAALAAPDSNEPATTESTKAPVLKHKGVKHHGKHAAKHQAKHYGRNVHHPVKQKSA
ncbi:MAG TPA: hypothetical protein VIF88_05095 [Methylocystis sp.]